MEAYAVVETGGKQYFVRTGDTLKVERLNAEAGTKVSLGRVLAVSDGAGLNIGTPDVEGARVNSTIMDHIRGKKIIAFDKKRRKGFSRKKGHRQDLTVVRIEDIQGD